MVWKIGLLAFLTGFFSLCVQVVATQFAFYSQPQSSHAIGLSLFAFLAGLGVAAHFTHRRQAFLQEHFRNVLALAFGGVGLFLLFLIIHAEQIRAYAKVLIPSLLSNPGHHYLASVVGHSLLFLLVPALGLGLLFPVLNDRITLQLGTRTGSVTSADYLGAGLGSLFCAFVLIPQLGMQLAGAVVCTMLIALALIAAPSRATRLGGVLFLLLFVGAEWPRLVPVFKYKRAMSDHVLFEEPSTYGLVRVSRSASGQPTLYINGRSMCYSAGSLSERLLASGPLKDLARPNVAALNIGLGCGFTALQFKNHPKVKLLDVVEINPVVIKANSQFNLNLTGDFGAATEIINGEGFSFVESSPRNYDVIAVDVEEPSIVHSSPLFTADFFTRVRTKLIKNGVFTLWTFYQPETAKIILNTLKSVFAFADVVVIDDTLVFFAADHTIDMSSFKGRSERRKKILEHPLDEIATIAKNPYAKYFKVNEVFHFEKSHVDQFEMKH